ncbi:Uma2 family endonuclease [Thiothrix fructosivorans]|uniref:Uma2 family endonuclease n=1 Tax=Thiothrix fructosivorans TaxID=111770 RepID=A0A8B0SL67_9GAMM|nr:Uma2 family endonuclease [Thiothrix fructosivorans]MBO0614860.1 Uma2 family endonuclease [Thiothrix fructosivorans]QTX09672.1 Uma2 family endonuclease [Thiothrix fructosivorans]
MRAIKNTAENPTYITEQKYLEGEKLAEIRHEYVDGVVYAMAGTSLRHNDIALNIAFALRLATKNTHCYLHMLTVKVRISKRKIFYYPDVIVSCEQDEADEYYLEKPCLIVEVTSKSTEWKDFTEKLIAYQKLASLQVYLIVAQDQPQVTLFYRDAEGAWDVARFDSLEQTITLPCPEATLTLADIYEGVDFTQPAETDA